MAGLFPTCVRNASGVVIKKHLLLGGKVADESVFHMFHIAFMQVQVLNGNEWNTLNFLHDLFASVCRFGLAIFCLTNRGDSKRSQLSRLAAKSQDTTATACSCVRKEPVLKTEVQFDHVRCFIVLMCLHFFFEIICIAGSLLICHASIGPVIKHAMQHGFQIALVGAQKGHPAKEKLQSRRERVFHHQNLSHLNSAQQ